MPVLRPMTTDDAETVAALQNAAFADLNRRMHLPVHADPPLARGAGRVRRCVESTPAGAWVTVAGDTVTGAALGIVREGLWGLSLLVVDPAHQSSGTGSALLRAALATAEATRGALILASEDPRALRAYHRAGFALRPCFDAAGPVRSAPARPSEVRDGRWPDDRDHCDAIGRAVRGAAHGDDLGASIQGGARLLVDERGGFALLRDNGVYLVAATDEAIARGLLRAGLAAASPAEEFDVSFVDAANGWAMDELVAAGVDLRPGGARAVRGELGPLTPYLPSGAYL